MSHFKDYKRLYEMKINTLRLGVEKAKETNEKIEKIQNKLKYTELLLKTTDSYLKNLKYLLKVVNIEEVNFRERRQAYLNENVTEALAKIFPNERFTAYIDCNISRGKNYAQLVLLDRDGNERLPFIQEGKMCQYLISFAVVKGVTSALGYNNIYIDEAFGASSIDNTQKVGPMLESLAKEGIQIILVSQNGSLYENIPHREICFHKDSISQSVIIDKVVDY